MIYLNRLASSVFCWFIASVSCRDKIFSWTQVTQPLIFVCALYRLCIWRTDCSDWAPTCCWYHIALSPGKCCSCSCWSSWGWFSLFLHLNLYLDQRFVWMTYVEPRLDWRAELIVARVYFTTRFLCAQHDFCHFLSILPSASFVLREMG